MAASFIDNLPEESERRDAMEDIARSVCATAYVGESRHPSPGHQLTASPNSWRGYDSFFSNGTHPRTRLPPRGPTESSN